MSMAVRLVHIDIKADCCPSCQGRHGLHGACQDEVAGGCRASRESLAGARVIRTKVVVGLCVHTMPFASLVQAFESFLSEGYIFLFKLSLAIVEAVADKILATNTAEVNKLFELLRLDAKLFPDTESGHTASQKLDPNCSAGTSSNTATNVERSDTDTSTRTSTATAAFFESIVSKARAMELSPSEVQKMRETAWESLQDKLEKVRAREQELKDEDSDEITFSDEDSDEEDEAARLARLAAQ